MKILAPWLLTLTVIVFAALVFSRERSEQLELLAERRYDRLASENEKRLREMRAIQKRVRAVEKLTLGTADGR